MALISLVQAKGQLRIATATTSPLSEEDADIVLKMAQAEAIVLDYLKYTEVSPAIWTDETVPALVQAAILIQLAELYRFRGDDPQGEGPEQTDGDLSPFVTNILRRYRDPALA